jgi:hypothetical protein
MTPGAQAILAIAVMIAVTATAIIVVPMVMSWRRGRQVGRLVKQLDAIKVRDVAESPLSEDELATLMREYTAERFARLTREQQRQMLRLLGRGPAGADRAEQRGGVSPQAAGGATSAGSAVSAASGAVATSTAATTVTDVGHRAAQQSHVDTASQEAAASSEASAHLSDATTESAVRPPSGSSGQGASS